MQHASTSHFDTHTKHPFLTVLHTTQLKIHSETMTGKARLSFQQPQGPPELFASCLPFGRRHSRGGGSGSSKPSSSSRGKPTTTTAAATLFSLLKGGAAPGDTAKVAALQGSG